jgi:predicted GNAT family N-acyltransferase
MKNFAVEIPKIYTASTSQEVEEIQRFRYQVYAKEMGLDLPGVDHTRQVLEDPLDTSAIHLYARLGSQLVGAVRLNRNTVPKGIEAPLRAPKLPRPFVYCSRLYVLKEWRGKGVMQALAKACFKNFFKQHAAVAICHCYPHLLKLYKALGFEPYGVPFVTAGLEDLGAQTPLRCLLLKQQSNQAA